MPQELPGFYYDAEKNRYFPLKGPIPGSSRSSSSSSSSHAALRQNPKEKTPQADNDCRTRVKTHRLLQGRELNGNVVSISKSKYNFVQEYQKAQASQPVVWRYQESDLLTCDGGLDETSCCVQTPNGQVNMDVLVGGGLNGCLSVIQVGNGGQALDNQINNVMPDRVWPSTIGDRTHKTPEHVGRQVRHFMSSSISSVKLLGRTSHPTADMGSHIQHGLVTTLGSETSSSTVFLLKFAELEDFHLVASMRCTIWTADCNSDAREAVIGTNLGAALVNLETGTISWLCRSKSDVLSLELNKAGNVALCGLRNGAILTVDTREKQGHSGRRISHRVQCTPLGNHAQHRGSWFRVEGNVDPSSSVCMPSSVCSLVSLQLYDQYFLASSMDGAIKLYDHRMTKRGAVRVYEGHVNSHTRLQLKVDPSERFLMAGGEDCHLRLWSVKSGELLFDEKVSDAVPSTLCWQKGVMAAPRLSGVSKTGEECLSGVSHSFGAWCGSRAGLIYTCWP